MWRRKCKVDLGPSPLEVNDTEGPRWWSALIDEMEQQVHKECTERPDVLLSVIGDRQTFKMVSEIFKLDENECDQLCIKDVERERNERVERERLAFEARCREEMKSMRSRQSRSMDMRIVQEAIITEEIAEEDEDEDEDEEGEVESLSSTVLETIEEVTVDSISISTDDGLSSSLSNQPGSKKDEPVDDYDAYTNPYLNFLRRPTDTAPMWRPRPPPTPTGLYEADPRMTLLEKSDTITNKTASDFCTWMQGMESATPPDIDEQTLIELFALDFDKPATRALVNRRREVTTLTPSMAAAWGFPKLDYRSFMRDEIRADIAAENRPAKTLGFGSLLDTDACIIPPRNDTQAQWRGYKPAADLASFSTAFADLTPLESYQGYVKYLQNNPQLPRPPCMKRWGIFPDSDTHPEVRASHTSLEMEQATAGSVGDASSRAADNSNIWSAADSQESSMVVI